jgi:hypothetical protein
VVFIETAILIYATFVATHSLLLRMCTPSGPPPLRAGPV